MFHVFSGSNYYPQGGIQDYKGTFPSFTSAALSLVGEDQDWAQVCILEDGRLHLVWSTDGWATIAYREIYG